MISYGIKIGAKPTDLHYYTDIEFLKALRQEIPRARLIIGFNLKFDLHWAARNGIRPDARARIFDCQIAEWVLTGQKGAYPSLNECLEKYGLGQKDDKIAEYWALGIDTADIPRDELLHYNGRDVDLTYALCLKQLEVLTEKQLRLVMVCGLDLLVLQEMEENGVKFDSKLCYTKAEETGEKLRLVTEELLAFSPTPHINLGSGQQLSILLYGGKLEITTVDWVEHTVFKTGPRKGLVKEVNHYKTEEFECPRLFTPLPKTDYALKYLNQTVYAAGVDILKQLRATSKKQKRIIELLLLQSEYGKLMDTYYGKLPQLLIDMEWGEYLHGQYNQCVAATGRLSSSAPNMQNFSGEVDQLLISRYDN